MTKTVLIVDDNPRFLSGTRMILELEGFNVYDACNGKEALRLLKERKPDLIISDILMPDCDGYDLLEKVHANPAWISIPFLFLTALDDEKAQEQASNLEVDSYLIKPISPKTLLRAVQSRLQRMETLQKSYKVESLIATHTTLANSIESRDKYTGGHINRVTNYAEELARSLKWSEAIIKQVKLAATLHDVGKIIIPDAVLNKPGKLTSEEWAIMHRHPEEGIRILQPLQQLDIVMDGVHFHHEHYDGNGYPQGLAGEDIPAIGRLIAIVDAFDAMTSDRPYRKGFDLQKALKILENEAGSQFDPQMVAAFIDTRKNNPVRRK